MSESSDFLLRKSYCRMVAYTARGKLAFINDSMQRTLDEMNFKAAAQTDVALLSFLCGYDVVQAGEMLQKARQTPDAVVLPVMLPARRAVLLVLTRLETRNEQDADLLVEMTDISPGYYLGTFKAELMAHVTMSLRNDLMAVSLSSDLLAREETAETKEQVTRMLKEKINLMDKRLKVCNILVEQDLFSYPLPCFPIDVSRFLERARKHAEQKEPLLKISVKRPNLVNLVYASPDHLETLFDRLFALMLSHLSQERQIAVHIQEPPNQNVMSIELTLANAYLDRPAIDRAQVNLKTNIAQVSSWGGSVELFSTRETGLRCIVTMRTLV